MALQGIKMTAPAGEPAAVAELSVPVAAAGDVLGGGSGVSIDPPPSGHEREGEDAVLGELENVDLTDDDFSDEDDDTDDESLDSDSEFEDDDGQPPPPPADVDLVTAVGYLGSFARFASVDNTAVFMRVTPAAAAPGGGNGGGEILVHYRYTRFLRAQDGGADGVSTHALGPKLACVRFHVPSHSYAGGGGRTASLQLQLAGAALVPLFYPLRFSAQLRALWSRLVAAWPVPRATSTTRVVVTVDAGILRPGDFTPARMGSMAVAMESIVRERDAQPAAELLLPVPLVKEEDVRPAKRSRVAGEDCPICSEVLEQDLAAWPQCSHIFHARCLEEHLVTGSQECPMCRSGLKVDAPQASTE
ncbi:unnamed protein product [Urochloa humidicola]